MNQELRLKTIRLLNKLLEWHAHAYGFEYSLSDEWNEVRAFRDELIALPTSIRGEHG